MLAADPAWASCGIVSGLASGEGLIHVVRDREGDQQLATKNVLCFESELARVLQAGRREGSTLMSVIRDAWDRGKLRVMTRTDPLQATGVHVAILAHITRAELAKDLDVVSIQNGVANRFIWVAVRRSRLLPHARGSFGVDFDEWDRRFRAAIEFGRKARRLEWDTDAAKRWEQIYQVLAEEDGEGRLASVLARAEAQVLRLTVAYSLLDC